MAMGNLRSSSCENCSFGFPRIPSWSSKLRNHVHVPFFGIQGGPDALLLAQPRRKINSPALPRQRFDPHLQIGFDIRGVHGEHSPCCRFPRFRGMSKLSDGVRPTMFGSAEFLDQFRFTQTPQRWRLSRDKVVWLTRSHQQCGQQEDNSIHAIVQSGLFAKVCTWSRPAFAAVRCGAEWGSGAAAAPRAKAVAAATAALAAATARRGRARF